MSVHDTRVEVVVTRHRLARRFVVRVRPDGQVRLTVPRGASIKDGMAFLSRQEPWIAREWTRLQELAASWTPGSTVWFRGERVTTIDPDFKARARDLAERELPARCVELAREHGVEIARVQVRDQRSRWGACSPKRVITLNWRLIQMPSSVTDYVILHELTHLKHPNHSRRFWQAVERICPAWRDGERWLRKHGRTIL
jgi:predicted metal-dependent hydrolase